MQALPSSYRDNDGFVFEQDGKIFRFIHPRYEEHYQFFLSSRLYDELVKKGLLLSHREITDQGSFDLPPGRVILPQQIPFISYPYEWSFDMWKDAALLTLQIALTALEKDMVLKDATPFNVQFLNGRPVFIDTLSFEKYQDGKPWIAYRQFCECFLAPLLLMHYCHPGTDKLFMAYPGGIPLDLLVSLLPKKARWNLDTYLHVYLQARFLGNGNNKTGKAQHLPKQKLRVLFTGILNYVSKLSLKKTRSTWDDYYTGTILGKAYLDAKTKLAASFLHELDYETVIDLGANDGHFSLLCKNKRVVAIDADVNCINGLYNTIKKERLDILPLVVNLVTPSPAIGWNNRERDSLSIRLKADLVMALALVHHLAIANNVPLAMIAEWLQPMGKYLLIEFVPKEDEKVQLLLQNREDIFTDYTLLYFKNIFEKYYSVVREERIGDTSRVLFLLKQK
jgi:hypothetical protein